MTVRRRESVLPYRSLEAIEVVCNACGTVTPRTVGVLYPEFFGGSFTAVIAPNTGNVNECTHLQADLCEACSRAVAGYIGTLKTRAGTGVLTNRGQYPVKNEEVLDGVLLDSMIALSPQGGTDEA